MNKWGFHIIVLWAAFLVSCSQQSEADAYVAEESASMEQTVATANEWVWEYETESQANKTETLEEEVFVDEKELNDKTASESPSTNLQYDLQWENYVKLNISEFVELRSLYFNANTDPNMKMAAEETLKKYLENLELTDFPLMDQNFHTIKLLNPAKNTFEIYFESYKEVWNYQIVSEETEFGTKKTFTLIGLSLEDY